MVQRNYRIIIFLFSLVCALCETDRQFEPNGQAKGIAANQGAIYYVAPTGDDSNPGTAAQPWQTIQNAANLLVAGETVYIRAGTYFEQVIPQNSGSSGQFITYAAFPGESVTIDGTGVDVPEYTGLFYIVGRSYVRVSGVRVVHSSYYGIDAEDSSYITIDHNYTYDTYSSGISSWVNSHVLVDSNEVVGACTGIWQEHISISDTDTFEVRYNHIHDVMPGTNGKEGMSIKDASIHGKVYGNRVHDINEVGIYIDAEAEHLYDVEVYGNIVHDIPAMGFALASEAGGTLENIRLYNNIAYHNQVGLWFSACCNDTHPFIDITVQNNTFAYNGRDGWGGGIGIENLQLQNVIIRNNICSQNTYGQMTADPLVLPQIAADHNLTDGDRDPDYEFYGAGDLIGVSPAFVNPAAGNFHLQASSPAIDAGSPTGAPATDFDGDIRPQDGNGDGSAGFDIGADEIAPYSVRVYLPVVLNRFALSPATAQPSAPMLASLLSLAREPGKASILASPIISSPAANRSWLWNSTIISARLNCAVGGRKACDLFHTSRPGNSCWLNSMMLKRSV